MGAVLDPTKVYVRRSDRAGTLLKPVTMLNGSKLYEGIIAREGVLEYVDEEGGVRRELVPFETLRDSAADTAWTPVTIEHPEDDVTPDNARDLAVGHVGEVLDVCEKGGFVRIRMVVDRADALKAIDAGKTELSPGYLTVIEETPGVHPVHGPYDAVQVQRIPNHTALVDEARGGPTVKLRADSTRWKPSTRLIRGDAADSEPEEPPMNSILRALVVRFDSAAALNPSLDDTQASMLIAQRFDQMESAMKEKEDADEETMSKEDADELRTTNDALTAENGELMKVADAALSELEKSRDQVAMSEMAPMADVMGLPIEKTDSADTLRRKLVAHHLGQPLDAVKKMDSAAVAGAYAVMRRDSATAAPSLGLQAWNGVTQYTQQRADAATRPPANAPEAALSPSAIAAKRADSAFASKWGA